VVFPPPREGEALRIRNDRVEFSLWPMRRTTRRWGIHSMLYATDPWAVIEGSLSSQCRAAELASAQSFVRQAREYYTAAERSGAIEPRPLLYYYSFWTRNALATTRSCPTARRDPGSRQPLHDDVRRFQSGMRTS
jgi:hypothetical protein